jgi:hypothetical protein
MSCCVGKWQVTLLAGDETPRAGLTFERHGSFNEEIRLLADLITQLDPQPPCLACTVVHSY